MAAPSTKIIPDEEVKEVEDDYESDEFEVEDDEGDEYQDDEDGEEEDEEVPQGNGKVSLLPVNKLHVPGALAVVSLANRVLFVSYDYRPMDQQSLTALLLAVRLPRLASSHVPALIRTLIGQ